MSLVSELDPPGLAVDGLQSGWAEERYELRLEPPASWRVVEAGSRSTRPPRV